MRPAQITTALLLAGCAFAAPGPNPFPAGGQSQGGRPFPVPSEGIEVVAAGDDGGSTLADVLRDFTRITGQNFSMSPATRQLIEASPVGLLSSVHVPPTQVYSFVEGLLMRNDLALTRLRSEAPALLGLYSMQERRNRSIGGQAILVSEERLAPFAQHPALQVRTVVDVTPANAKELSSSLRNLASDSSLYLVMPVGSTSVVVQGPGAWVVDVVATMDDVVANHEKYRQADRDELESND
jgi:hypothetical protein